MPAAATGAVLAATGVIASLQVAALTNLVELECYHHEPYISFDYGALQPLSSSLRRLLLDGAASPPSCLSQLTALESLALLGIYSDMSDEERELFRAALPHLQHLAQLDLYQSSPLPDAADQAAFASCPRLAGFGYNADTEEALPLHGPWLRNLRHLVARLPDVAGSLPALSSTATQLQQLVVCFNCWDDPALSPAVVDWAVHHSSLRKLVLAHQGIEPAVREQLLRAASRRTTLCCQLTG